MKDINEMIIDIQDELHRVKSFVNDNGYHNGTAINKIVSDYRFELKKYLNILVDDSQDGIINYEADK